MKAITNILLFVCLSSLGSKTVVAQCLNSSNSPIVMLPSADIAQGIAEGVKNSLEKYYHKNYPEKFPEDMQLELMNNSDLTFFPNSDLTGISNVISYDNDPSTMVYSIENYISSQVRTIIITEIDSKGNDIIVLKSKAINVLSNLLIIEKDINIPITEIDNVGEKIHQLAKEMLCKNEIIRVGFGFGYQKGDQVSFGNIPSNIRTVPPHPDDVKYRPDDILDPNNPDNYLIIENTVNVALKHRISIDIHLRFWGILNIAIQTSAIKGSEIIEGENLYRKSYIKEGAPGGDALFYYLVRSKNRSFFDGNSFRLPIYITYPVFYFGKNEEVILYLLGGTNLLLPDKISLEAEKGWHRFNERQKEESFDLGELKETEFFAGIEIEGAPTNSIRFGIQFLLVYREYQDNFNIPLFSLQQSNNVLPSLRLNLSMLFGSK